jgi:Matrixin
LRGVVFAASLALPFAACAFARADETQRADSEFRLLVLDGSQVRWALPQGRDRTIVTYAFLSQPAEFKGARNCSKMLPPAAALDRSNVNRSAFRHEVRAAFDMWEAAANIAFRETANVDDAGILIGAEAEPRGRAFTNVTPHGSAGTGVSGISQSLICLNPETRWKIGFDGNLEVYDLRYTIAHEIGHAIGLDHPSAEGQLMSYRYVERERGLRPGDAAGAAQLYGLPLGASMARTAPASESPTSSPQNAAATPPSGGARFGIGESEAPRAAPRR